MALEALANPLSGLQYLPRGMNYAVSSLANDPYYSATHQYVKNDVCLSEVDGGAYVFLGGATDKTATRGVADPSADANWVSLKPDGANSVAGPVVPVVTGGPVYVVTVGTLTVPAESEWLVTFQCSTAKAGGGNQLVNEWINWTLTAGANTVRVTQLPNLDTVNNYFSMSALVAVPAGATTIVLGAAGAGGAAALAVSATRLVATRVL